MKKLILLLSCLLLTPAYAFADDCVSDATGDWDAAGSWTACGGGFPEEGDTAEILAAHTITVKGTEAVGTSPADYTTDILKIGGTLVFENAAADSILNVFGSIIIQTTGKLEMGTLAAPMNCGGSARLTMKTDVQNQNYDFLMQNGAQIEAHGCMTYHGSTPALTRARIVSCAPDCTAGAVVVTLDQTHGWAASTGWAGDGIIFGVGGNETTKHAAGDDPEIITTWATPGADTIGVTFVEDHMAGDMVEIVRRNVVIDSDDSTNHGRIYTETFVAAKPYSLSYIMINEMGWSTSQNQASINAVDADQNMGSMDYVAITNAEDGSSVTCFYINASWDSFEGNTCWDSRGNSYTMALDSRTDTPILEFKNCSAYGSANGQAYGIASTTTQSMDLEGFWSSHNNVGMSLVNWNGWGDVHNCVIHGATGDGVSMLQVTSYFGNEAQKFHDNEVRNSGSDNLQIASHNYIIKDNNFDGAYAGCINMQQGSGYPPFIYMSGNTYDNCNTVGSAIYGAIIMALYSGHVYMNNEEFGQDTANKDTNFSLSTTQLGSSSNHLTVVCNNCLMADPIDTVPCSNMPIDGYQPVGCSNVSAATWSDIVWISEGSSMTFHNKDQVEDAHIGWGPGGMVFQRQTGVVYTTSNLKMKITPASSTAYSYIKVGTVAVENGDALEVDLYLRKDEAVTGAGWRPRLVIEGCGFERTVDYDEMSDVTDTWEKVTVSGTADWKGGVHIYVGVRGVSNPAANAYTPVWPPTLDVYADGLEITK